MICLVISFLAWFRNFKNINMSEVATTNTLKNAGSHSNLQREISEQLDGLDNTNIAVEHFHQ